MDRQTWSRMRLWDSPANVRLVPMYFQSWSSPSTGWSNPLCLLVLVLWRHTQLRLSRTPWHVISKASFSELTDWNKLNFLIFGKVKTDPNLNHYFMFPRADVFLLVCLQNRLLILDYWPAYLVKFGWASGLQRRAKPLNSTWNVLSVA